MKKILDRARLRILNGFDISKEKCDCMFRNMGNLDLRTAKTEKEIESAIVRHVAENIRKSRRDALSKAIDEAEKRIGY